MQPEQALTQAVVVAARASAFLAERGEITVRNKDGSILLVEDEPDDVELAVRELAKLGVQGEVVVVEDGAEALDYLFAQGQYGGRDPRADPAVVLLDLMLPKIGGLEVLKRLRKHERTMLTPVVVLTSSQDDRDRAEAYSLGANSYVRKPLDSAEFERAVRQLGLLWLLVNQPPPDAGRATPPPVGTRHR